METLCGEPAGWLDSKQNRCLGPKCIAQREAARGIYRQQQQRQIADMARPIFSRFNQAAKRKRERREKASAKRNGGRQ